MMSQETRQAARERPPPTAPTASPTSDPHPELQGMAATAGSSGNRDPMVPDDDEEPRDAEPDGGPSSDGAERIPARRGGQLAGGLLQSDAGGVLQSDAGGRQNQTGESDAGGGRSVIVSHIFSSHPCYASWRCAFAMVLRRARAFAG